MIERPVLWPPSRRVTRILHYAAATALVAGTLGLAFVIRAGLGEFLAFTLFYPTVIICAAFFGRRVAIYSLVAAATFTFVLFVRPYMTAEQQYTDLAALAFFVFNGAFAIWLIGFLRRTLGRILAKQQAAEALARSQCELLQEVRSRTAQHLQLVAGVLSMQAKGEPTQEVSEALQRAAQQSLVLARAQGRADGQADEPVDLSAQAAQLVATVLAAQDRPAGSIVVEPSTLCLPSEQATSISVALLECVDALARQERAAGLTIRLAEESAGLVLRFSHVDEAQGEAIVTGPSGHLLRAAMHQLQGRMWLIRTPDGCSLELSFPRAVERAAPAATVLH